MCVEASSSAHTRTTTLAAAQDVVGLRIRRNNTNGEIAAGITWIARDNVFRKKITSSPNAIMQSCALRRLELHRHQRAVCADD